MKVEHTSRDHIIRQIARDFRFTGEVNTICLGAIAEHLRAGCLIMETAMCTTSNSFASSIQLCKQTFRRVTPLFPELLESVDEVREELNHLQDLGDLVRIDGHFVCIAPARCLEIDTKSSLLLGGGPIEVLPMVLRKHLVISGRSRILSLPISQDHQHVYPFQRLEDWLGLEDDDMLRWANAFAVSKVKVKRDDLVPEGLRFWDGRYWCSMERFKGKDGVCLCRRNVNVYGNPTHEYGLIRFRRILGNPNVDSYFSIERDVARKLQGALRPVRPNAEQFIVTKVRQGILELTLPHPIAEQHSKLLLLGWKPKAVEKLEPGVQKIEFSEMLLPLMSKGFGLIGYELVSK